MSGKWKWIGLSVLAAMVLVIVVLGSIYTSYSLPGEFESTMKELEEKSLPPVRVALPSIQEKGAEPRAEEPVTKEPWYPWAEEKFRNDTTGVIVANSPIMQIVWNDDHPVPLAQKIYLREGFPGNAVSELAVDEDVGAPRPLNITTKPFDFAEVSGREVVLELTPSRLNPRDRMFQANAEVYWSTIAALASGAEEAPELLGLYTSMAFAAADNGLVGSIRHGLYDPHRSILAILLQKEFQKEISDEWLQETKEQLLERLFTLERLEERHRKLVLDRVRSFLDRTDNLPSKGGVLTHFMNGLVERYYRTMLDPYVDSKIKTYALQQTGNREYTLSREELKKALEFASIDPTGVLVQINQAGFLGVRSLHSLPESQLRSWPADATFAHNPRWNQENLLVALAALQYERTKGIYPAEGAELLGDFLPEDLFLLRNSDFRFDDYERGLIIYRQHDNFLYMGENSNEWSYVSSIHQDFNTQMRLESDYKIERVWSVYAPGKVDFDTLRGWWGGS